MPEEKEQTPNKGQKPSSLDQDTLDQILAESQGNADQLESMLNSLGDRAEADVISEGEDGVDLSDLTDDMEAMLERMESDESEDDDTDSDESGDDVSDLNDMLYQATLADVAGPESEEDDDVLDLDEALESLDDDEEDTADALVAEAEAVTDEGDDALDALLEEADNEEDTPEAGLLEAMLEDVEDEVPEDVAALEDDDLDAMLLESEVEQEADGLDAMLEEDEESTDLDALLEDDEEESEEEASEDDLASLLEEDEESTDLDALLEDVEEESEEESSEDDLASLLEEDKESTDLDALLEDVDESSEEESTEDDLASLLEEDGEATDLDALLEDVEEESTEDDLASLLEEDEESADLDALLEDVEEESEEESSEDDLASLLEEDEESTDLDALLEDVDESSEEESSEDDLASLLEEDEESADLDALLEDVDESSEEESSEDDLASLLEEDEESTDLDALLEDDEALDLDDLLDDEDSESLLDDDLDDLLATASEESNADILETTDDLDDLLGDEDTDLDDLLEDFETEDEPLNVGVEDEVAQILATGESLGGDDHILDEFKSVQESIIASPHASGDVEEGSLLVIDGDADQRTLFEDALGDQYIFAEADTISEGLQILHNENIDLILLSLDDDSGGALEFIEQVNASLDMPSIPIIVTSEHTDRIENALRLGAVDYLTRPLDVMDIEFQVPQKVSNQMKLQKAERILAGSHDVSVLGADYNASSVTLEDELDLDDLVEDDEDFLLDDDSSPEDLLVRPSSKKDPLIPLSDQQKILRNRKAARKDVSRLPLFALIVAFLVATVGAVYHYSDEIKDMLPLNEKTIAQAPPRPKQPLPKVKMPEVPKQNYASSSMPTPPPARENVYQQQADVLKSRIRQNVRNLADNGGAWWSPWRVMRESGGSVSGLVDRQSVQDILTAFGVDDGAVERGLQSQRTLDYLAGVGFDLRGKRVSDLSAREAFELLSARQIKNADQIVEVLSKLTDGLAADRTAQEEHKEQERRKRKGQAMLNLPKEAVLEQTQMVTVDVLNFEALSLDVVTANDRMGPLFGVGWLAKHRV